MLVADVSYCPGRCRERGQLPIHEAVGAAICCAVLLVLLSWVLS